MYNTLEKVGKVATSEPRFRKYPTTLNGRLTANWLNNTCPAACSKKYFKIPISQIFRKQEI